MHKHHPDNAYLKAFPKMGHIGTNKQRKKERNKEKERKKTETNYY